MLGLWPEREREREVTDIRVQDKDGDQKYEREGAELYLHQRPLDMLLFLLVCHLTAS